MPLVHLSEVAIPAVESVPAIVKAVEVAAVRSTVVDEAEASVDVDAVWVQDGAASRTKVMAPQSPGRPTPSLQSAKTERRRVPREKEILKLPCTSSRRRALSIPLCNTPTCMFGSGARAFVYQAVHVCRVHTYQRLSRVHCGVG